MLQSTPLGTSGVIKRSPNILLDGRKIGAKLVKAKLGEEVVLME